ncbi:unnamed protein product [Merluccius merluccius]
MAGVERESDRVVRLVMMGAAGVGKSALIRRFQHGHFERKCTRTVEELHALTYRAADDDDAGKVRLEILDTGGSYAFPAMRELSIRRGDAFALVYAVDDPASFREVARLRDEILARKKGARLIVVGHKADLTEAEGRVLFAADVAPLVEKEWRASFVEASSLTGTNAVGVFLALLQHVRLPQRLSPVITGGRARPPLKQCNSCPLS